MARWFRRKQVSSIPTRNVEVYFRPINNERDRQALAIRETLRQAGCQEWFDRGPGKVRNGFVIETEDPFLVRCSDGGGLDREAEERGYAAALTSAGYYVEPITGDDDGGFQVWPPGHRRPLPKQDPREMLNDWIRTLTVIGEGHSPDSALALIAKVNQPGQHLVQIRTPLPQDDVQALNDSMAWLNENRSRQAGVSILVEQLLIQWLADATGQTWSEIVQRLAQTINTTLPPE